LGELYEKQQADQTLEALCVLYVALTRAKEATFVILNKDKTAKPSPARDWILGGLPAESAGNWGTIELLWETGTRDFNGAKAAPPAAVCPEPILLPPHPRLRRRLPSEMGRDASLLPAGGAARGMEFGTAVHDVFEQIEWWTPGQELQGNREAIQVVRRCLEGPEVAALFRRECDWDEALRELPMELKDGEVWWSGVIDRLVLRRDDDGALRRAVLIDFKTDRVTDEAALRDRYAEQLGVYRDAVAAALGLPVERIETVLLSTHLPSVLRLV
jgi:ATP-dependent exoDNAse (exonuclease V) beta subunit